MPVHEAEAVVLRQYSLSEADRILVLFTREAGKLRATAHGVKRPRSRLSGALEPLNHVRLQYYSKEGADLVRVRQADLLHSYLGKHPSLEKVCVFSYFAELIQEFAEDSNPSPLIFRLFLSVLNAGEGSAPNELLVRYFEIWMLRLSGLLPNYDYCSLCGRYVKDEGFLAWLGQGRCQACAGGRGIPIHPDCARMLQSTLQLSPESFAAMPTPDLVCRGLESLTQPLLESYLEKKMKSYKQLRDILRGGLE